MFTIKREDLQDGKVFPFPNKGLFADIRKAIFDVLEEVGIDQGLLIGTLAKQVKERVPEAAKRGHRHTYNMCKNVLDSLVKKGYCVLGKVNVDESWRSAVILIKLRTQEEKDLHKGDVDDELEKLGNSLGQ